MSTAQGQLPVSGHDLPMPLTRGRLRWALADAWAITVRDLTRWLRMPDQLIGALVFPVVSVLLFGYVFGSAIIVPGDGDYREFLMPGIFAMTMMFGITNTAVGVVTDKARGVTDRFRSMPMAPSAVVTGRSGADLISGLAELTVLVVCGLAVGWQWHDGTLNAVAAIGLLVWLRVAFTWVGIALGLVLPNPESTAYTAAIVFPLMMVSNVFVSPELLPRWLGVVAEWNPLSATVTAARELFANPGPTTGGWPTDHALELAIAWPLVILVVTVPFAVRRYHRLGR